MTAPKTVSDDYAPRLADISRFVYGTTRLGDDKISADERVKIARAAMDAGVWFHTSDQYNDALQILNRAFAEDRAHIPPLFFKIGNASIGELRKSITSQLAAAGVEQMEVGQLCLSDEIAESFRTGGSAYEELQQLKDEGLVNRFVLEVFPWTSSMPFDALRAGYAGRAVDAYIFYLNPLQRFADNPLWDLIQETHFPIVAMRTVAGGDVQRLRDVPGAAWKEYLQRRAVEVAPLYENSGASSWPEFCARFALSIPQVRATVGSTSSVARLREFLTVASGDIEPLPIGIQQKLLALQRRWSDDTDMHAEPWTM